MPRSGSVVPGTTDTALGAGSRPGKVAQGADGAGVTSPLPTMLPHDSTMLGVSRMWVPSTAGTPSLSCPGAWPGGLAAAGAWAGGLSTAGELTPVPMAAPRELTCSTVTSAGADGAARSENILFPCKCHQ